MKEIDKSLIKQYEFILNIFSARVDLPDKELLDFFYKSSVHSVMEENLAGYCYMDEYYIAEDLVEEYVRTHPDTKVKSLEEVPAITYGETHNFT